MERIEINGELVMLVSENGVTDTRNGQTYSVVVCRKRDERFFAGTNTSDG